MALCYYEYYWKMVRTIVNDLGIASDEEPKTKKQLELENKLKTWIENRSVRQQLNCLHTTDRISVTTPDGHKE